MKCYPAFVCEKGHVISADATSCNKAFCNYCGSKVISTCPNCGQTIPGRASDEYLWGSSYNVPAYCSTCGKPYPWTLLAIETTIQAVEEARELSGIDVQQLQEILPDVMVETPQTPLAGVRIKKAIANAGKLTAECLKQFVVDHGCDLIRSLLELP